MISVLPVQTKSSRTFGWVQDPSNLRSLCDVVAVFDEDSLKYKELVSDIIPSLLEEMDGRDNLLSALSARPLKIAYTHLVGKPPKAVKGVKVSRKDSRCNAIIQATVKGQKGRPFIGDWPADNFVRWAYAFGFIKYDYTDDTFSITQSGLKLTNARKDDEELSNDEREILITAILAYPPAVRILNLLAQTDMAHLTKFEIGRQLGFVGEGGFTSQPQSIFIKALANESSSKEKNKMKTDWEGSSDKYARTIANWLQQLGLVEQLAKDVTVIIGKKQYTETLGHAYMITTNGIKMLNRTVGKSKHKRIPKNICFEMLATKGSDREYLRTRRAYLIKFLSESKVNISAQEIVELLATSKLIENIDTIKDDIQGLINIGLNIIVTGEKYQWNDDINDFVIPLSQKLTKSSFSGTKDAIRAKMMHLSHEYLSLIDLAYDSKQNRLFEMKTLELLTEECNYSGLHLGGSSKPDGIVYTTDLVENYGVIVDTKAYSKGYNLPIRQVDEMRRYIEENKTRDKTVNTTEWWNHFNNDVNKFYFMFVSGHFVGNFATQIKKLNKITNTDGVALAATNLLLCADLIKSGTMSHQDIGEKMFVNDEFVL